MYKGQIFSTDLLFAMILMILCLGTIISAYEFNLYNQKQDTLQKELKERTETAIIALTNSVANCQIEDPSGKFISLAYSININKITTLALNPKILKETLAIQDTNLQIKLSTSGNILAEGINTQNIVAIDINVITCNSSATMKDLNDCMTSPSPCNNPNIKMQTLSLKVGQ